MIYHFTTKCQEPADHVTQMRGRRGQGQSQPPEPKLLFGTRTASKDPLLRTSGQSKKLDSRFVRHGLHPLSFHDEVLRHTCYLFPTHFRPLGRSRLPPPSRSHVRIPRSGPIDSVDHLLLGRGLVPLWNQKATSHFQWRIHTSSFLNLWTSGTQSLQGGQFTERIPKLRSTWRCLTRHRRCQPSARRVTAH